MYYSAFSFYIIVLTDIYDIVRLKFVVNLQIILG